jgi:hypothetical protein
MEKARQCPCYNEADHLQDYGPEDFLELVQKRRLKATKVGRFLRYCLGDVRIYKVQQEQTDSSASTQSSCRCAR